MNKTFVPALAGLATLALAGSAAAHGDPAAHGSVATGLAHPLHGADHVLAMLAVGLWAMMLGGRAVLAVPASFVAMMAAGLALAAAGLRLPMADPMILASVLVLGLVVALAVRLPVAAGMGLVGAFALFHGLSHGAGAGTAPLHLAGLLAGTAMLHAAGGLAGLTLARLGARGALTTRIAGGAIALAGAGFAAAGL